LFDVGILQPKGIVLEIGFWRDLNAVVEKSGWKIHAKAHVFAR
jgi:hypothetical protein